MPGKQNGTSVDRSNHLVLDPEDPEYIKDLQRPAVIKEDMHEMERRKRVHQILESKPFRKELEELIIHEKSQGASADNIKTLEKLSDLVLPRGQLAAASLHGISMLNIHLIASSSFAFFRYLSAHRQLDCQSVYALKVSAYSE